MITKPSSPSAETIAIVASVVSLDICSKFS
jgi:hypothetical protein